MSHRNGSLNCLKLTEALQHHSAPADQFAVSSCETSGKILLQSLKQNYPEVFDPDQRIKGLRHSFVASVSTVTEEPVSSKARRLSPENFRAWQNELKRLCDKEILKRSYSQGWKPSYLALGCQFRCVETWMLGFSFGLVSDLLKNRSQFWFQLCLRTASVSGFQFRFKFHPRKLFYFKYGLLKSSTSGRFCFITMISSSSEESNCFRSCPLGFNSESGKTKG